MIAPLQAPALTLPPRAWGARECFQLEQGFLVRVAGRRQTRWPLARLKRVTLGVRRSPYTKPLRFMRLSFGRQVHTIVCGPQVQHYAAFVYALARAAPHARLEAEGGRLASVLVISSCLLAAGAVAMALAAVMAGLAPLGLDLASRLGFLLILVFAVTPWIGRTAPRQIDPDALPAGLVAGA